MSNLDKKRRKNRLWTEEDMEQAYKKAKSGRMSTGAAAEEYDLTRKTRGDRLSGEVNLGSKHGYETLLSKKEEDVLVKIVLYMTSYGWPVDQTRNMLIKFASSMFAKKSHRFRQAPPCATKGASLSSSWWHGFKQRHPQLSLHEPNVVEQDKVQVMDYFHLLSKTMRLHGFIGASQIYSCDETSVELDHQCGKVVVLCGSQQVSSRQHGIGDHVTFLSTICADGSYMPPLIVFKDSFPRGTYSSLGPYGSLYLNSPTGHIGSYLFCLWFKIIFIPGCGSARPVVLMMDNHSNHLSPELIQLATDNSIILYCLPAHSTHLLHPLHVAVFRPLKQKISEEATSIISLGRCGSTSDKANICMLLKAIYPFCFCKKNVKHGFRKTGLFPFDPSVIDGDTPRGDEQCCSSQR